MYLHVYYNDDRLNLRDMIFQIYINYEVLFIERDTKNWGKYTYNKCVHVPHLRIRNWEWCPQFKNANVFITYWSNKQILFYNLCLKFVNAYLKKIFSH